MEPRHTATVPHRPDPVDDWRDDAKCSTDLHPDRWVDLPTVRVRGANNPAYDTRLKELSAICDTCPVRVHCLWEALNTNVRGVFAGTDEYDRADLRETLNLPTPPRFPHPENDEDARLIDQQFTALRYARQGRTNTEIADLLGVSPMTVSRLTAPDDHPADRRTKSLV